MYVQLKIFSSLIEKAQDQDVDMLDIVQLYRHRNWSINNYCLLSTNTYFEIYTEICIQCNYVVSIVWAGKKRNLLF